MSYNQDTIAAIATPNGRGGIGVIRVSGPDSVRIGLGLTNKVLEPRVATFSKFFGEADQAIDEGLLIYFRKPHSFTGEDIIELQGHGGRVVMEMLLKRVIQLGARQANPGEFSQRAFLNDKIDLTQAEAIADLIDSASQEAALASVRSLQGEFSQKINSLLDKLIRLRVLIEADLDFPEDDIEVSNNTQFQHLAKEILRDLDNILGGVREGVALSEGVALVLTGKPNAGKSSLMNALCKSDTSIVTDIPGTTTDVVKENAVIAGVPFRIMDTAGMRMAANEIEAEGLKRASAEIDRSDIILRLVDVSQMEPPYEVSPELRAEDPREMIVCNKIDLVKDLEIPEDYLTISAKTGEGLDELKQKLSEKAGISSASALTFTARSRHIEAIEETRLHMLKASELIEAPSSPDLVAEELRLSQKTLSRVTGAFSSDDLLGEIFQNFCIGK
ncbi:MAG: tRNA uridine-5-carboxymethylaminomethyl(34) synthesis GTPase MnmE [Gammaproteobacteria bacterium]|nr:tRNA uridine-5-carboxymethylaminomethyl(34) synthesis GTPase MnmE [Gammaproteobacteria bacterium]|tara:strand:+ start:620 stop:1954 length:1335 start_codon:yes stop_codon:yes gene_type:complete